MKQILKSFNIYYAMSGGFFVPFPLMENEPKRSSASRCSNRRLAQATAPRSAVGANFNFFS